MIKVITSNEINDHDYIKSFIEFIDGITKERDGYIYYKYPILTRDSNEVPFVVVADKEFGVLVFYFSDLSNNGFDDISIDFLNLNNEQNDSLLFVADDYATLLYSSMQKIRQLRNKVIINKFIIFPYIKDIKKNNNLIESSKKCGTRIIDLEYNKMKYDDFWGEKANFNDDESNLFISVIQGIGSFNKTYHAFSTNRYALIGDAIKGIDNKISVLAHEQQKASIQIPDGPQRIRGMAGTGKTIILTMKAAFLHSCYPDSIILYTFHTQALYNQIKCLITMFYRDFSDGLEPDWNKVLVRHSWGTKVKEGVYTRTCLKNEIMQKPFLRDVDNPLDYVYSDLNKYNLKPEIDYVLIDEAQDFPASFFQVIYKITNEPKRIIFAYDELQSLDNIKTLDVEDLFGRDEGGKAIVDFSKSTYGNGIEKDYILRKSYRNPIEVLMLAHGIGLGIHNLSGKMQIISNKEIWESIGYDVNEGECESGNHMIIKRPKENSISVVHQIYSGDIKTFRMNKFNNYKDEIKAIVSDVDVMVNREKVNPKDILIIALTNDNLKEKFLLLQAELFKKGISSIAPGFNGIERDIFGIDGSVTLSTVHKAKGNEAFVVYVMGCEAIYDYSEDTLEIRNKTFTAFSRTKGWLHISGVGQNMENVINECKKLLEGINKDYLFDFVFPDDDNIIRKLSPEEHARRKEIKKKGSQAFNDLLKIDNEFLKSLPKESIDKLIKKLSECD